MALLLLLLLLLQRQSRHICADEQLECASGRHYTCKREQSL